MLGVKPFQASVEEKDLLRFLTCGSVDDGKSTLLGRLLYDCKLIHEDQRAALIQDFAMLRHHWERLGLCATF